MHFRVEQRFSGPASRVIDAYCSDDLYPRLRGLGKVGDAAVVSNDRRGTVVQIRVRYRFVGDLPRAALAVLDPEKLTWIDDSSYDLDALTSTTTLLPDHYADRLTASARSTFAIDPADEQRSRRTLQGSLEVRMPFVGGQVEKAIVSGLTEHLADEQQIIDRWIADHGS